MNSHTILIVEDDPNLLTALKYNLEKDGYEVTTAVDGVEAIEAARQRNPKLIVLDVMLPKMNGFEVCRILRKEMTVPILMLTAKAEITDKIVGLEIGADDYMTKPFNMRELLARVRAMLRRVDMTTLESVDEKVSLRINTIDIDPVRYRVTVNGDTLKLTPKEYELLVFLARNRRIVFSREQLLEKVWGYEYAGDTRTVDVHIRWLRQKIESDPGNPEYLITVRGTGYKLEG